MDDKLKSQQFATRAIHLGRVPEDATGAVSTPIFLSSTYRMKFPGDDSGYVYSRWSNPTRLALEKTLANLENGRHGYFFASGLAAVTAILHLLRPGDHVVAVSDLYGGTHRLFEKLMRNFGIDFSYVEGTHPDDFARAAKENTRLIWIESPTNPLLKLIDIKAVADIGHERGILTVVDNTFATPYIQRPLELGADIVHHSATKYLGGHCDVVAGAVVVRDEQLAEKIRFNQYAAGATLGPFDSWLVLRGLKTLALRMERHAANAARVGEFLKSVDLVDEIHFPGLDGQSLPNGMVLPGGMVSFTVKADIEAVKKLVMATEVFVLAESLGGVESLINHPASMTHASIPKEVREAHGVTDGLIRLSVGIEDAGDLIADLKQAFTRIH
jgi:cystathionine gamma-lyase